MVIVFTKGRRKSPLYSIFYSLSYKKNFLNAMRIENKCEPGILKLILPLLKMREGKIARACEGEWKDWDGRKF